MTPLGADQAFEVQVTGWVGGCRGVWGVGGGGTRHGDRADCGEFLDGLARGSARPGTIPNLNYVAGQTVPNLVTVAVGDAGRVSVYNRFGTAHVVFDVVGFYADDSGPWGSRFHAIDPFRYFDTRDGSGGVGLVRSGQTGCWCYVLGKGGVPAGGVSGVVMNVTATQPSASAPPMTTRATPPRRRRRSNYLRARQCRTSRSRGFLPAVSSSSSTGSGNVT